MTPERMAQINALAKGDPLRIGQELLKVIKEQEAEITRLTRQRDAATRGADRIADRAIHLRAERNQATAHLHRLVDHQDDPCHFDHHGTCQAHFVDGSEPGKCGVVEARQFVAALEGTPVKPDAESAAAQDDSAWAQQADENEAENAKLTEFVLGADGGALVIECQRCGVSNRYSAALTLAEVIDSHRCAVAS